MARRECSCGKCGDTLITEAGTFCGCGGLFKAIASSGNEMLRKAYGKEDTDLGPNSARKGGLR